MPKVLISYRRSDTAHVAGRIFDKLVAYYGADNVFMDISNTPFGIDFREHIAEVFSEGDILVALIGREWAGPAGDGSRRIDRANDMVRIEVETALQRKIPLIPVLIDDAPMPQPSDLPLTMEALAYRNAAELDSFRDFHPHMDRLIQAMDRLVATGRAARTDAAAGEVKDGGKETAASLTEPLASIPSASVPPAAPAVAARGAETSMPIDAKSSETHRPKTPVSEPVPGASRAGARPTPYRSSSLDRQSVTIARFLHWGVLIVLILMFARSLVSMARVFDVFADLAPTWYYLWELPTAWVFVVLFLAWELFAARSLPSPVRAPDTEHGSGTVQLLTWPYATFVTIRDALGSDPKPRWPVGLVFVGFFVSVILPKLVGLFVTNFGDAVYLVGSFYRIVELIWTAALFIMIWQIGRSPIFRKV